jgi:alpha-tubulin suppressor-like RCC1 family protein
MLWWNAASHWRAFLFETALLVSSVAVGVSLFRRTPARSLIPRATKTALFDEYLHLPRRTRISTSHACVVFSLVLLSAYRFSIAGSIAAGYDHTCALTASGGVRCWGGNSHYGQASAAHECGELSSCHKLSLHTKSSFAVVQLGDGTTRSRNTPSADVLTSVAAITAGVYHTCALTTSGGVRCWGFNLYGQASAALLRMHVERSCHCIQNSVLVMLRCCAAWRWHKYASKHAISRCTEKCGFNHCWRLSHMRMHSIWRCEMLGSE